MNIFVWNCIKLQRKFFSFSFLISHFWGPPSLTWPPATPWPPTTTLPHTEPCPPITTLSSNKLQTAHQLPPTHSVQPVNRPHLLQPAYQLLPANPLHPTHPTFYPTLGVLPRSLHLDQAHCIGKNISESKGWILSTAWCQFQWNMCRAPHN